MVFKDHTLTFSDTKIVDTSYDNMEVMMRNNTSPYNYHSIGRFENDTARSYAFADFTGQHRCIPKNNLDADKYGLIVYSTGKYVNIDNALRPTMNDSLPICDLCSIENDVRDSKRLG